MLNELNCRLRWEPRSPVERRKHRFWYLKALMHPLQIYKLGIPRYLQWIKKMTNLVALVSGWNALVALLWYICSGQELWRQSNGRCKRTALKQLFAARQQILNKEVYIAVTEQRCHKQICSNGNESTRNNRGTVGSRVFCDPRHCCCYAMAR
jgi:hypothetical protein